ncbi:MAG: TldD/PmbA family protein [Candidatus Izemoplasmatales bacterium]
MMNIELLFKSAKAKGVSDVSVFLSNRSELSLEVFDGELDKYEIADTSSMTVRGVYNGKMGSYVTEVLDDSLIPTIVDAVIESAKIIDSLDDAIIYAGDKEYAKLDGLLNENLTNEDVALKIAKVKALDKAMHAADPLVTIVESMYTETTRKVLLQNTKGLKLENVVNSAMFGGSAIVKNEADQRTSFDLVVSNDPADFVPEKLAGAIVSDAVKALGAKPVPTGAYEIVFHADALATLLSAFQGIFSAEAVQKNMSLLKGKLNTVVGSPLVSIVDDPFQAKSSRSRSFDDEGVATRYKAMIDKGELKTFLYNLVTAKKDGVASTGNGFGSAVAAVNLKFLPGTSKPEELLKSCKKGLWIKDVQGAHAGANPISGDFSLQASGFVIEDGIIGAPVALVTVAGNFVQMMKDVVGVADDSKTGYYGITTPSVKIASMAVAGI